ncbi:S10 family peptidase [Tabrizicola piscis]|uniref:S10 family peptidase n=1 Tax=Tabrizicola piscis TaxID=2494374 RepID=UPI001FE3F433|nr:peptidase S10 [Tabrizicola piscis]
MILRFLPRMLYVLLAALLWAPCAATAQETTDWTATAGMIPIGEDPERPDAELFHVDYIKDSADPATRPVTFLVNGGPGGASIFLHIAAIGPLTIASPGDGTFPAVPAKLEPNPDSWIDFTDLVFIDPVGTGYSRMLPGSDGQPGDPKKYYAVDSDMHSIAWFIRQWLTANDRWGSPKALAGESYGGQRVSGLSQILARDYGINLNMAILISPALHTEIPDTRYSILGPITMFPTQAAIAAHWGMNGEPPGPEALEEFERFALNEFANGLVRLGRADDATRAAFFDQVAGMIGLDTAYVARKRARIGDQDFATELLQDKGLMIDRYDGTVATENPIPELPGLNVFDRSLAVLTGVLLPPFMDHIRGRIGYQTDRNYIPLSMQVNLAWDRSSPTGGPDDLALSLAQNPDLRALVVHGMHDLATPYFRTKFVLEQSLVNPEARKRLLFGVYPGGHMFYLQKASRAEFAADVRAFYAGAN